MKKLPLLLVVCAVALIAIVGNTKNSGGRAQAQDGDHDPIVLKTAGPISINSNDNEGVLIGLLLPAVRNEASPFRLQLIDGTGTTLYDIPIAAKTKRIDSFFDVFYQKSELGDGSVHVIDKATGQEIGKGKKTDGILIALLLPAVQRNGERIGAIAGSVQIMSNFAAGQQNGIRGQVIQMCDGSVRN